MKINTILTCLLLCISLLSCFNQSNEKWIEDIDFFAENLPKKQLNFYHLIDSSEFQSELTTLKGNIAQLNKAGKVLELQRQLAKLHISQTNIPIQYSKALYSLPLRIEIFDDGLFIYGIDELKSKHLEKQIISINHIPLTEVYERLKPFISHENEYWFKHQLPHFMIMPQILEHARIINNSNEVRFQLADGKEIVFRAQQPRAKLVYSSGMRHLIWLKKQKVKYWFERINNNLLYVQFNKCFNDEKYPFENFVADINVLLDSVEIQKILIDLRANASGHSELIMPLIQELKQHREIKYYGAIGRRTYSSGPTIASIIREQLNATLIGEPSGGNPNSYSNIKTIELPHSKLPVNYTTTLVNNNKSKQFNIKPDVSIPVMAQDVFEGTDKILEYVLNN